MAKKRIEDAVTILCDTTMLTKIGNINFSAEKLKYHHSGQKSYITAADRIKGESKSSSEYTYLETFMINVSLFCLNT